MPLEPFRLIPEYRDYIWGGDRLRPGQSPTAEAWVVYEGNRIANGPLAGRTLAEASGAYGAELLGRRPLEMTGTRFPLLIKLLDCAEWLSLQVHPDDAQAEALEGPGHFGKTEAWHVLDADLGAEILCGFNRRLERGELETALHSGRLILDAAGRYPVHSGDTLLIEPGTLHALGPGLLIYEVQQTSNLTYRIYDWDRPASAGRALHIDQSLAVLNPELVTRPAPLPPLAERQPALLTRSRYFELTLLAGERSSFPIDTQGISFHALTVFEGQGRVSGPGWEEPVGKFETLLVPAAAGAYQVTPLGPMQALISRVP